MGYTEFYENINSIGEKVKNLIDDRKDILIVSNSSCDGIISASLLIKAIWKLGGKATARFFSGFNGDTFSHLKNEDHGIYLRTLALGYQSFLSSFFRETGLY
jgi:single-stranded DNA-specific DHH superfamily exonuclease